MRAWQPRLLHRQWLEKLDGRWRPAKNLPRSGSISINGGGQPYAVIFSEARNCVHSFLYVLLQPGFPLTLGGQQDVDPDCQGCILHIRIQAGPAGACQIDSGANQSRPGLPSFCLKPWSPCTQSRKPSETGSGDQHLHRHQTQRASDHDTQKRMGCPGTDHGAQQRTGHGT